jgi:DNA-binding winged helix-turn-helix (wHTH) protein/Flp pilus assembly protein TadD
MPFEKSFEFADWRVEPARGVVSREGKEVRLEPKLMELLLVFAASPGRVITKNEIVSRVWSGRAIGDDTLSAAISRLRTALGETKSKRYIETLPKRGYRALVTSGQGSVAPRERDGRSETDDLVAKGLAALRMPMPPSLAQARTYFEAAIARDSSRADAHTGLADAMLAQLMMGADAPPTLASSAKAAAQAATALDPNLAPAWSALGMSILVADRDFASADGALARAVALAPDLSSAHGRRAFAFAAIGRFADAEREARRAVETDPFSFSARTQLLQLLLNARRYPQAIAEAKRAIAMSAQSFEAWAAKGWAHAFLGEEREAVDALRESLKLMGIDAATVERLDVAYAKGGFEALAAAGADLFSNQRVLFTPRPLDIALLRAAAGQFDAAFAALDIAASRNDPVLLMLPWLPHLDRLRNDPRFNALAERVRLVR